MGTELPVATLLGFLVAMVRITSWMLLSPPFNTRTVPRTVKLGLAAGMSLPLASHFPERAVTFDTLGLLGIMVPQILTGVALGYLTQLMFKAIEVAGSLIDVFGGFTMSMSMDPFGNSQSSVFGRFYGMLASVLLFVTNGHLFLIRGFMTSFDAIPVDLAHVDDYERLLVSGLGKLMLAAVEIAGPLLASYFLAEIVMGLLTKAAPQLNVMTFGFPFKILLTLLMISSAIPLVPDALHNLLRHVLTDGLQMLRVAGTITPIAGR